MSSALSRGVSRREFLGYTAALPFLLQFHELAAAQRKRLKIRDVQVMMLEGGRTYTLVKITADDGLFGIGEAYGSPGVGVKEQMLSLKPWLVGKDPLEIDALYTDMGDGVAQSQRHAHRWLGAQPDARGQRHRDGAVGSRGQDSRRADLDAARRKVPRPRARLRSRGAEEHARQGVVPGVGGPGQGPPERLHRHKFGFPHTDIEGRSRARSVQPHAHDQGADQHPAGLRELPRGDRLGSRHHGSLPLGVRPAHVDSDRRGRRIDQAVWLEDPLPVDYSDSWKRLCASSKVPICTGENLARREGFKDFIMNQGCDILHPDLRNSGGFLETKRIADLAHIFGLPMANHNTGSQVYTYASAQWAASIRDYMALETVTGEGGWMDQVLVLDGPVHQGRLHPGHRQARAGHDAESGRGQGAPRAGETWWGRDRCRPCRVPPSFGR